MIKKDVLCTLSLIVSSLVIVGCAAPSLDQDDQATPTDAGEEAPTFSDVTPTPRPPAFIVDCSNQSIDDWYDVISADFQVLGDEFEWLNEEASLDAIPAKLEAAILREETLIGLGVPDCAAELSALYVDVYAVYIGMYESALAGDWEAVRGQRGAYRRQFASFEQIFNLIIR